MTGQPVIPPAQDVHSPGVRRAWISVALLPVSLGLAIVLGEVLASALGYQSGGDEPAPLWIVATSGIPAVLVGLTPGALAVWFGLRARRDGDERGLVPAIVGGVLAAGFVGINLLSYLVGVVLE